MDRRKTLAVLLSVTMFLTMACGIVNTLTGLAGGGPGTVSDLWSDVPPIDGATKANLDLPLPAKAMIQTMFQGKLAFIAYTTGKSAQDVQNFYTADRMKAAGWNSDAGGCLGSNLPGISTPDATSTSGGALCFFGKQEEGKDIGLAIVIAQDDKTKQTQLYYVRIDVTPTPTPAK